MTRWFACDVDDGVLRGEDTRRELVRWLTFHFGGEVLARHRYGPGRYEYTIGLRSEDGSDRAFVVREDRLDAGGWDARQTVLYPMPDDPHQLVERIQDGLEDCHETDR